MMSRRVRGAVVVISLAMMVGTVVTVLRTRSTASHGPIARRVAGTAPTVRQVGRVRFIENRNAPEELLPDSIPPASGARLLWLEGRRAAAMLDGAIALDGVGGVIAFDDRLRPRERLVHSEGREWLSVAAGPKHTLWLTDATGALLSADSAGRVTAGPVTPFSFADVATDPHIGTPWLVRSARRFSYQFARGASPIIVRADTIGRIAHTLGTAFRPQHVLLEDLANAGQVAVSDSVIFYAPFIRDELIAMTFAGETLWVSSRGLPQSTPEPRFELDGRRAVVNYHPVNIGVTLGPDGRVYVLSTQSASTLTSRLDVFDPSSGALLRTGRFATSIPTLAADATGRVYVLDAFRLIAGVSPSQREPVPSVDLPALGGGSYVLAAQIGRVQLLNLWASWCGPCREEMPALDSLQRQMQDPRFVFVGLNDDVDPAAAQRFMQDHGFDFAVALGHGALKERFHVQGLPATILVDREGREVHRWIGYSGPAQIASIRTLVLAELARFNDGPAMPGMNRHGM